MKLLKLLIIVIVGVSILSSIWVNYKLHKYKSAFSQLKEELKREKEVFEKISEASINSQIISMNHLGKTLSWLNLQKIYPEKDSCIDIPKNPKLVLLFSEFGCNVCQDNETRFAVEVADEFGENFVLTVVQAGNERYVRNYIRMNQVNFPVYHCVDDLFFTENKVKNTPMILFLDEDDRVIASHFPLPGHPEFSEPIHRFCSQYLKQYIDSTGK